MFVKYIRNPIVAARFQHSVGIQVNQSNGGAVKRCGGGVAPS